MACPRRVALLALLAPLALLALPMGCKNDPGAVYFDLEVVRADGKSPLADGDVNHVRIDVRQGGGTVRTLESDVGDGGDFDLRQAVDDTGAPLSIRVELTGPERPLLGAPPPFAAVETVNLGQLVRIPVGPSGACMRLADIELAAGERSAGVARLGSFALVVGGIEAEGPSGRAGYLDLLAPGSGTFDDLSDSLGATQAVAMSDDVALVVSDSGAPLRYDLSVESMRRMPLELHDGAGGASAVASRSAGGAAVVGGAAADGEPVDGVSWVGADGSVATTHLATPRANPAIAPLGSDALLVAGGMAEGEPLVELAQPGEPTGEVVLEAPDHGVRDGGYLVVDAVSDRAMLLGGSDGSGAVRADTLRLDGCSSGSCEASGGPAWPEARAGVAVVADPEGGAWLVGGAGPSSRVERVRWSDGTPGIALATTLAAGRDGAGAFLLRSGVLWVVAGQGAGGPRRDVELCFPDELRAP